MGRNNADFVGGHGMGWKPQIGPAFQRIQPAQRGLSSESLRIVDNTGTPTEEMVPVSKIRTTKRDVDAKTVKTYAKTPAGDLPPVKLWKDSQGLRLADGNHRVNAAIMRGDTHVKAYVYNSKDYK